MDILNFLISPKIAGWLLVLKIIFLIFSLFFLVFIISALLKTGWLRRFFIWDLIEFLFYKPSGVMKIAKKWRKTIVRLETNLESEYKLAVIEADSMVDDILKSMGYKGETLGERLKQVTSDVLPNLEQLGEAHKIRNNIVHDPDYRLSLDVAKKAISFYERALTDLGAF